MRINVVTVDGGRDYDDYIVAMYIGEKLKVDNEFGLFDKSYVDGFIEGAQYNSIVQVERFMITGEKARSILRSGLPREFSKLNLSQVRGKNETASK